MIEDFPIRVQGTETPARLLKAFNIEGDTKEIVIIGLDDDGIIGVSSSYADPLQTLGLIEVAKASLIED
jgi:hypothetical protein